MGEEWESPEGTPQNPDPKVEQPNTPPPVTDDIDKRIEDIKRMVTLGAVVAQQRIKQAVDRASDYWQNAQTPPAPRQPGSVEEQRIRQLVNMWSTENWRVARELGSYMDIVAVSSDEIWEATLQTRWETRSMEVVTEPYTGRSTSMPGPLLPVWDYELPPVIGLKAPQTRTRLEKMDEVVACTVCNGNGRTLCSSCTGRGWIVCPDCKGRTKKRCSTCRGRGYVADWTPGEKKPFFKKQAENVANSVGGKISDVFEGIRQQGVPVPNPLDTDPASKGRTIPCPDCVNGEVDCTCGNGKRVCSACQGSKMSLCSNCAGTGKLVRHREIVRGFDTRLQTRVLGDQSIPVQQLSKASGDLLYSAEINEPLYAAAPPEGIPVDVWRATVDLVETESQSEEKPGMDFQKSSRPTLQVIELVRIPYTRLQYRFSDQDYLLYIYDSEGKEKFYADQYPARWDRIERLVKAISVDLIPPQTPGNGPSNPSGGYRVPIEHQPYTITEEDDDNISGGY
ncbi:MAG TPA: hypothetical protein VKR06_27905 [Ktedonosporobacter sp.]|nr:hypothetical protein [Ktedonosporobacter sp.]